MSYFGVPVSNGITISVNGSLVIGGIYKYPPLFITSILQGNGILTVDSVLGVK